MPLPTTWRRTTSLQSLRTIRGTLRLPRSSYQSTLSEILMERTWLTSSRRCRTSIGNHSYSSQRLRQASQLSQPCSEEHVKWFAYSQSQSFLICSGTVKADERFWWPMWKKVMTRIGGFTLSPTEMGPRTWIWPLDFCLNFDNSIFAMIWGPICPQFCWYACWIWCNSVRKIPQCSSLQDKMYALCGPYWKI